MDGCKFDGMRLAMDQKMRDLAARGLGSKKRQTEVISLEEEKFNAKNKNPYLDIPDKLRNTLLYLVGLNFALR